MSSLKNKKTEIILGGESASVSQEGTTQQPEPEAAAGGGYTDDYQYYQYGPWNVYTDYYGCYGLDEEEKTTDQVIQQLKKMTKEQREEHRNKMVQKMEAMGYERVRACPDSGAIVFVAPKRFAPGVKLEPSPASINGVNWRAANGGLIPALGQKHVKAKDINGNDTKSLWQIADVTRPLAGLIATVKASNRVVFDEHEGENVSHIYNKPTRTVIPIEVERNQYEFDMFIPKAESEWEVKGNGRKNQVNVVESQEEENVIDDKEAQGGYKGIWEAFNEDDIVDLTKGFAGLV